MSILVAVVWGFALWGIMELAAWFRKREYYRSSGNEEVAIWAGELGIALATLVAIRLIATTDSSTLSLVLRWAIFIVALVMGIAFFVNELYENEVDESY